VVFMVQNVYLIRQKIRLDHGFICCSEVTQQMHKSPNICSRFIDVWWDPNVTPGESFLPMMCQLLRKHVDLC